MLKRARAKKTAANREPNPTTPQADSGQLTMRVEPDFRAVMEKMAQLRVTNISEKANVSEYLRALVVMDAIILTGEVPACSIPGSLWKIYPLEILIEFRKALTYFAAPLAVGDEDEISGIPWHPIFSAGKGPGLHMHPTKQDLDATGAYERYKSKAGGQ